MKKSVTFKFYKLVISLLTMLAILVAGFCLSSYSFKAFADEGQPKTKLFSPSTSLEYASLSSPTAIYHDEEVTAIIETIKNGENEETNKSSLKIYKDGEFTTVDTSKLNKITDIKRKDQTQFYFSAEARLFSYDFVSKDTQQILLNENEMKSVSYFDFNDEYVVTAYQDSCDIYKIDENDENFTIVNKDSINIFNGSNVAINNLNDLFIVRAGGIYKRTIESANSISELRISDATPQKIIANDNFVYYLLDNEIHKMNTDGSDETPLSTLPTDFDLGKIDTTLNKPTNLAFNGDNLLLIINDTVQEFKVNGKTLEFTGFAIAQNKTAYNRVSKSATQVEK